MKLKLAAALALMTATHGVHAADAETTIEVTGRINAGSCALNLQPSVILRTLAKEDVINREQHLVDVPFTFTACIGVTSVNVTFSGTPHPADEDVYANDIVDGAQNVAIALMQRNVPSGKWLSPGKMIVIPITDGSGGLEMDAAYYTSATLGIPTVGDIQATVTVNVLYN
ncbi:TPA: fimbrial protein [Stenotrophomonas maltophilia]